MKYIYLISFFLLFLQMSVQQNPVECEKDKPALQGDGISDDAKAIQALLDSETCRNCLQEKTTKQSKTVNTPRGKPRLRWRAVFPVGEDLRPQWRAVFPLGENLRPQWRTVFPLGEYLRSQWRTVFPEGENLRRRRRTILPGGGALRKEKSCITDSKRILIII
jgi:hypothetical protein